MKYKYINRTKYVHRLSLIFYSAYENCQCSLFPYICMCSSKYFHIHGANLLFAKIVCYPNTINPSNVHSVSWNIFVHYNDVIIDAMASQITRLTIVYSTVYSCADQRKHQSSASLAFVRGTHRWPVNSPHKWLATRKLFPFGDVIMICLPKIR